MLWFNFSSIFLSRCLVLIITSYRSLKQKKKNEEPSPKLTTAVKPQICPLSSIYSLCTPANMHIAGQARGPDVRKNL